MEKSMIIMAIFIALCVSFYKFMRKRNKFHRITFWSCAAVLAIMLCADSYDKPAREDSVRNLVAALRETENELKKYEEIYSVEYQRGAEGLVIKLTVNDLADENFLRDNARKIFNSVYLDGGGVDNIKVSVEIEKSARGNFSTEKSPYQ